jgi:LPS export ABC transporter protein LptC
MDARRLTVLVCALLSAACQKPATPTSAADPPALGAEQVLYGVDFNSSSGGVTHARTHADTAYVFNRSDSSVLQLRGLTAVMYDESGKKTATVTSRRGSINTQTRAMVATGNVVLVTSEGKRVTTEELHYDPNSKRVWSNVHTVMLNPDGSRQSMDSFTSDDTFRNFQAHGAAGSTGIKL